MGEHHNWFVQYYDTYEPSTLLQSWGFASMGFGVCGVLGAKLAAPEKKCVCVCGDGGFMMTPHILCTAVEYNIPAVWVIFNNYGWNVIRHQANGAWPGREIVTSFRKESTGELYNPDFVALAKACGANGAKVEKPGDFKEIFHQAVHSNEPFVIGRRGRPKRQGALGRHLGAASLPPRRTQLRQTQLQILTRPLRRVE